LILDAALPLFASAGYEATGMADVAAAAGMAKPSVYEHFADKHALYVALVSRERDRLLDHLAREYQRSARLPLEEKVRADTAALLDWASRAPLAFKLLYRSATSGDASLVSADFLTTMADHLAASMSAYLRRHGQRVRASALRPLAALAVGAIVGVVLTAGDVEPHQLDDLVELASAYNMAAIRNIEPGVVPRFGAANIRKV
jgi:AcrR family transcriptional regulator